MEQHVITRTPLPLPRVLAGLTILRGCHQIPMSNLEDVIAKKIEIELRSLNQKNKNNRVRNSAEVWIKTISSNPRDPALLKDRIALIRVELDGTQEREKTNVLATELVALKWLLWMVNESRQRHIDPEHVV